MSDLYKILPMLIHHIEHWPELNNHMQTLPDLKEAEFHKITPHIVDILKNRKSVGFSKEVVKKDESIRHKREILLRELNLLNKIAQEENISYSVLRGFAFQTYYPSSYIRQFNDIDIIVRTPKDLYTLMGRLKRNDYFIAHSIVVRKQRESNDTWIGIALNKITPDLDHPIYLDVTLGGPSISDQSHYSLQEDAWESCTFAEINGVSFPVFSVQHNIMILLAEAFERKRLALRDLLDFHQLLQRAGEDIDDAWISEQIRGFGLEHEARRFVSIANKHNIESIKSFGNRLHLPLDSVYVRKSKGSDWRHHMLKMMRGRKAASKAANLLHFLLFPFLLRFQAKHPHKVLRLAKTVNIDTYFDLGLPLYLFPNSLLDDAFSADIMFSGENKSSRVQTPIGIYCGRFAPIEEEGEWDQD
jgi:hypothetical protein